MTRALHTFAAPTFAQTVGRAKAPVRACTIGYRSMDARRGTDAKANALATRCALH